MTISESFKRFQYFNFETNFLENKNFLVETTKIESTSFPFKTALSETNVRQTEWQLQNGSITKSRVFGKKFPVLESLKKS